MLVLYPFGLTADQIVWWGFVATAVAAVCAIWGGIAATAAAKYGKDAPTKDDLARVEQNTAHLDEVRSKMASMDKRQQEQHQADLMREAARHISIHVKGEYGNAGPMTVRFTTQNPTVVLLSAQLRNDLGSTFGQADCVQLDPQEFTADFNILGIQEWYGSATTTDMQGRRVLTIRTHLRFGQQDADRDISTWVWKRPFPLYSLEGNC